MQISTITYSESIETVNDSFNKKWFKSKIEISDVGNDLSKATEMATQYVSETLKAALANNPDYVPNPISITKSISAQPLLSIEDELKLKKDAIKK
jgi:hypothetical protein